MIGHNSDATLLHATLQLLFKACHNLASGNVRTRPASKSSSSDSSAVVDPEDAAADAAVADDERFAPVRIFYETVFSTCTDTALRARLDAVRSDAERGVEASNFAPIAADGSEDDAAVRRRVVRGLFDIAGLDFDSATSGGGGVGGGDDDDDGELLRHLSRGPFLAHVRDVDIRVKGVRFFFCVSSTSTTTLSDQLVQLVIQNCRYADDNSTNGRVSSKVAKELLDGLVVNALAPEQRHLMLSSVSQMAKVWAILHGDRSLADDPSLLDARVPYTSVDHLAHPVHIFSHSSSLPLPAADANFHAPYVVGDGDSAFVRFAPPAESLPALAEINILVASEMQLLNALPFLHRRCALSESSPSDASSSSFDPLLIYYDPQLFQKARDAGAVTVPNHRASSGTDLGQNFLLAQLHERENQNLSSEAVAAERATARSVLRARRAQRVHVAFSDYWAQIQSNRGSLPLGYQNLIDALLSLEAERLPLAAKGLSSTLRDNGLSLFGSMITRFVDSIDSHLLVFAHHRFLSLLWLSSISAGQLGRGMRANALLFGLAGAGKSVLMELLTELTLTCKNLSDSTLASLVGGKHHAASVLRFDEAPAKYFAGGGQGSKPSSSSSSSSSASAKRRRVGLGSSGSGDRAATQQQSAPHSQSAEVTTFKTMLTEGEVERQKARLVGDKHYEGAQLVRSYGWRVVVAATNMRIGEIEPAILSRFFPLIVLNLKPRLSNWNLKLSKSSRARSAAEVAARSTFVSNTKSLHAVLLLARGLVDLNVIRVSLTCFDKLIGRFNRFWSSGAVGVNADLDDRDRTRLRQLVTSIVLWRAVVATFGLPTSPLSSVPFRAQFVPFIEPFCYDSVEICVWVFTLFLHTRASARRALVLKVLLDVFFAGDSLRVGRTLASEGQAFGMSPSDKRLVARSDGALRQVAQNVAIRQSGYGFNAGGGGSNLVARMRGEHHHDFAERFGASYVCFVDPTDSSTRLTKASVAAMATADANSKGLSLGLDDFLSFFSTYDRNGRSADSQTKMMWTYEIDPSDESRVRRVANSRTTLRPMMRASGADGLYIHRDELRAVGGGGVSGLLRALLSPVQDDDVGPVHRFVSATEHHSDSPQLLHCWQMPPAADRAAFKAHVESDASLRSPPVVGVPTGWAELRVADCLQGQDEPHRPFAINVPLDLYAATLHFSAIHLPLTDAIYATFFFGDVRACNRDDVVVHSLDAAYPWRQFSDLEAQFQASQASSSTSGLRVSFNRNRFNVARFGRKRRR